MTTKEALEIANALDCFEDIGYLDGSGAEFRYWFRTAAKTIRDLASVLDKTIKPFKDGE